MIIGIDIDDTLTDLTESKILWVKSYLKDKGYSYNLVNSKTYKYKDMFDWPPEICDDFWFSRADELYSNVEPRKGVKEIIEKIKNDGHKIIIVTARSQKYHKDPWAMSYNWLTKNEIPFDELVIDAESKGLVCKQKNIDILIDDVPSNLEDAKNFGIKTILIRASHNMDFADENQLILENWNQILDFIKSMNKKKLF